MVKKGGGGLSSSKDPKAAVAPTVEDSPPDRSSDPKRQPSYLTSGEVASQFGVNRRTITRWTAGGLVSYNLTLGGHRRFNSEVIERLRDKEADNG